MRITVPEAAVQALIAELAKYGVAADEMAATSALYEALPHLRPAIVEHLQESMGRTVWVVGDREGYIHEVCATEEARDASVAEHTVPGIFPSRPTVHEYPLREGVP